MLYHFLMGEELIGNYKVLKQIGAGGMAKVYLAVHRDVPNLKVILKILSDPRLARRFTQEADKLALLDGQPNICRIKHFFTHGDDTVIAMEYIDGITLDEKLKNEGRLSVNESVRIIASVLQTLEFAHQRGVFHRDIKPSNIMVDSEGTVKIIDFGIAKGESDPSLTLAGTACGTPPYMAPEQFTPTENTNYTLVDVYAAGTTLYHMVTGELPFEGDNEFTIRDAKLFTDPKHPTELNPAIPGQLESVILKAIDREPENRYQTAGEMREAVHTIGQESSAQEQAKTDAAVVPRRPASSRNRLKPILIGAIMLCLAAVVGYWLLPTDDAPTLPQSVTLIAPDHGALFADDNKPQMSWQETAGEGGSYIIEYATDSIFSDGKTIAGLTSGSFAFSNGLVNGDYFWRVYPISSGGLRGEPSAWRSLTVDVAPSEAPTGTIEFTVNPSGDIYLDGLLLGRGKSRMGHEVQPGRHIIRVENGRSREKRRIDTVIVAEGQTLTRSYNFSFPPPKPVETLGEVRVGSRPRGATIHIDGELQPQKTNYTFRLKEGRHIIRASLVIDAEEHQETDTIMVVVDSTHKLIFDFE